MKTDRETAGIGGEREAEGGTRSFPRFDLEHLRGFKQYLQGIDGGNKSAKSAHEAAVDVSKYLRLVLLFYFFTLLE